MQLASEHIDADLPLLALIVWGYQTADPSHGVLCISSHYPIIELGVIKGNRSSGNASFGLGIAQASLGMRQAVLSVLSFQKPCPGPILLRDNSM